MIESKRQDVVGLSPLSGTLGYRAEVQCPADRKLLRLTISVEKIDILLTDIQDQVEDLQRQMANLGLVRTQLASCQQENGGDEGAAPQSHATFIGLYADASFSFDVPSPTRI